MWTVEHKATQGFTPDWAHQYSTHQISPYFLAVMRWVVSATCSCCHDSPSHPSPKAMDPADFELQTLKLGAQIPLSSSSMISFRYLSWQQNLNKHRKWAMMYSVIVAILIMCWRPGRPYVLYKHVYSLHAWVVSWINGWIFPPIYQEYGRGNFYTVSIHCTKARRQCKEQILEILSTTHRI